MYIQPKSHPLQKQNKSVLQKWEKRIVIKVGKYKTNSTIIVLILQNALFN